MEELARTDRETDPGAWWRLSIELDLGEDETLSRFDELIADLR